MQITNYWKQTLTFGQNFITTVKSDRNVQIGLIALATISLVGIIFLILRSKSTPPLIDTNKVIDQPPSKSSVLSTADKIKTLETPSVKNQQEDQQIVEEKKEPITQIVEVLPNGKITLPVYPDVELLSFAEARKRKIPGDLPKSEYVDCLLDIATAKKIKDKKQVEELEKKLKLLEKTLLEPEEHKKHLTALFASCFHTTESHHEIYQLLLDIRNKIEPIDPKEKFPLVFLYQNLTTLLNALPLEKCPQMKIYWSPAVEKKLIPKLIVTENYNVNNLLLAFVSGEEINTADQAPLIDFKHQFQFVAVNYKKFLKYFDMVMTDWTAIVYNSHWKEGELIDTALMKKMVAERENMSVKQDCKLLDRTHFFTFCWNAYHHLSEMKRKNQHFNFSQLDQEDKTKHLRALYSNQTVVVLPNK